MSAGLAIVLGAGHCPVALELDEKAADFELQPLFDLFNLFFPLALFVLCRPVFWNLMAP